MEVEPRAEDAPLPKGCLHYALTEQERRDFGPLVALLGAEEERKGPGVAPFDSDAKSGMIVTLDVLRILSTARHNRGLGRVFEELVPDPWGAGFVRGRFVHKRGEGCMSGGVGATLHLIWRYAGREPVAQAFAERNRELFLRHGVEVPEPSVDPSPADDSEESSYGAPSIYGSSYGAPSVGSEPADGGAPEDDAEVPAAGGCPNCRRLREASLDHDAEVLRVKKRLHVENVLMQGRIAQAQYALAVLHQGVTLLPEGEVRNIACAGLVRHFLAPLGAGPE